MAIVAENSALKKPNVPVEFGPDKEEQLLRCSTDPVYFANNFVKVQHPMLGIQPLTLYPYQIRLMKAFHEHRYSIALTARQMGKSLTSASTITHGLEKVKIKSLIKQTFRERVVLFFEEILLQLSA